jgi:hypothetical protein
MSEFNPAQTMIDVVVEQRDEAVNRLANANAHIRFLQHKLENANSESDQNTDESNKNETDTKL